jgi:tetratricopeptide (TPR) repeat protein
MQLPNVRHFFQLDADSLSSMVEHLKTGRTEADWVKAHFGRGTLLMYRALADDPGLPFKKITSDEPSWDDGWRGLEEGERLAKQGDHAQAIQHLSKACVDASFNDLGWAFFLRARSYAALGEHLRAAVDFKRAIAFWVANSRRDLVFREDGTYFPGACHCLSQSLIRLERYHEALEWLNTAIEIRKNDASFYHDRAEICRTLGDVVSAANDEQFAASLHGGTFSEPSNPCDDDDDSDDLEDMDDEPAELDL